MKVLPWLVAAGLVVTLQSPASSETYKGIGPYYTFNDVKALFPNAEVQIVPAAWVQPHQVVVNVTGVGMDGTTIIIFKDLRVLPATSAIDQLMISLLDIDDRTVLQKAIVTEEVRWAPSRKVPVANIIELYGKEYRRTINRDTLGIVLAWEAKGVYAHLNDDAKSISFVEYIFTKQELGHRYLRLKSAALERKARPQHTSSPEQSAPLRNHSAWRLYQKHCAACHGHLGEGAETVAIDNAWSQGEQYIRSRIEYGADRGMPGFQSQLSHREILEITDFVMQMQPAEDDQSATPAGEVL